MAAAIYDFPLPALYAGRKSNLRGEGRVRGIFTLSELSSFGAVPRAYPFWILSNFHVVNDTVAVNPYSRIAVYIGLCEQCSGIGPLGLIAQETRRALNRRGFLVTGSIALRLRTSESY